MSFDVLAAQSIGIASAFAAAGGITTLSLIDVPVLQSLPASRSLPQIRWLFSRGSHIYPTAGILSMATFAYVAYALLPKNASSASELFKVLMSGGKVTAYAAAALLCYGLDPWTRLVMVPTNFKLMDLNAEKGGYWSADSAQIAEKRGGNAVHDAVKGERNTSEFSDLSGPQSKTTQDSTPAEDREVRELLSKFSGMNYVRAGLLAGAGTIALLAALTP